MSNPTRPTGEPEIFDDMHTWDGPIEPPPGMVDGSACLLDLDEGGYFDAELGRIVNPRRKPRTPPKKTQATRKA